MWRIISAVIIGTMLTSAVLGGAASLGLVSDSLFSTFREADSCDTQFDVSVSTTVGGGNITVVTVSGIDDACQAGGSNLIVQIQKDGQTIAARSGLVLDSSEGPGEDSLALIPTDTGDEFGNIVAASGSTDEILFKKGTVGFIGLPGDLTLTVTTP